jgi:LacI family transcriptional regulator
VAYGAWEALRLQDLEVPRDISLIGFDDQHAQSRVPALSSVRVEAAEVGRQLARMAIAKIGLRGQRLPEVALPTQLMKRETCRPLLTDITEPLPPTNLD